MGVPKPPTLPVYMRIKKSLTLVVS
jgi:hypothetical protein